MPRPLRFGASGVLAVCYCLAGCDRLPGTEEYATQQAQARVSSLLIDPGSAVFSDIQTYGGQNERVCGSVNAKNRAGGYTGAYRFVSTPSMTVIEPTDMDATTSFCLFEAAVAFNCADTLGPAIATASC